MQLTAICSKQLDAYILCYSHSVTEFLPNKIPNSLDHRQHKTPAAMYMMGINKAFLTNEILNWRSN